MKINLVRIDDWLIYGQVIMVWVKEVKVGCIIICSDDVYNDEIWKILLKQVVLLGIKVNVVNIEKVVVVYYNLNYINDIVFYLFINLIDVL